MRTGSPHGLRYSPGNMDHQSLEALFVGRDDLMEDVLSRVTKSVLARENTTFSSSDRGVRGRPTSSPWRAIG